MTGFSSHFGINNIPFGVASGASHKQPQCVSRFENTVIFLAEVPALSSLGLPANIFTHASLNAFAALGRPASQKVRATLQELIKSDSLPKEAQEDISAVTMHLPVQVGDYTDFSCSPHHNRNAGQALMGFSRGLPPAYLHHPLGYAGRCSSIGVSGTPIRRPRGQYFTYGAEGLQGKRKDVTWGPVRWMDYELEMGVIIGKEIPTGEYVHATKANENIFGFVLQNDWSSRDIQQLEMIPVGPYQSKHTATTISAWIITPDALEPFRVPASKRDYPIAPYLDDPNGTQLKVDVEVNVDGKTIGKTNCNVMDWTFEQLVAHQSSAGCGLRAGDLLCIGTISGPSPEEQGCLLEGHVPGSTPRRDYIQDNEEVQLLGYAGEGVGFGECKAKLLPAVDASVWNYTAPEASASDGK